MRTKPSGCQVSLALLGIIILSFFAGQETFSWVFLRQAPGVFFWARLGLIGMLVYFFSSTQMWASSKKESQTNLMTCLALAVCVFALSMARAQMMS